MLTLFTRCLALLTIALGIGTMAVSAYAARQETLPAAALGVAAAPTPAATPAGDTSPTFPAYGEVGWFELPTLDRGVAPIAGAEVPEPDVVIRYAAPLGAASVDVSDVTSRDDLSTLPEVDTKSIVSLKPRPVNLLNLAAGGLDIPLEQLGVMQQVSAATGIPWQILAGIAKVESNFGQNMATSSAGAIGYGQFLPVMWAYFGNGGDPYDFRDALPAMGRYLVAAGAPGDLPGAIYSYNHSWSYVDLVLAIAQSYGYQRMDGSRGLIWPVAGAITRPFGNGHAGIDIDQTATPRGPARAAHDGVVYFVGGDPCCGYGLYVMLSAPSGMATLYAHLSSFSVLPGQTVAQGQQIGLVGCTGRCTGPHLHFEVIQDNVRVNPLQLLP